MKKTFNLLYYYFAIVLVVFLPFQSLILSVLQDKLSLSTSLSFWLAHWYEPVLVVLLILSAAVIVRDAIENLKNKTSRFIRRINWPSILLILYGIISIFFLSPSISRGVEGFRFDLLPVLLFFLMSFLTLPEDKTKILVKTYLIMALLVAGWAIIERFLPPNYWSNLGLAFHGYGYFGFGIAGETLNQSASFLGGPNQLGSYLLPAAFIILANTAKQQYNNKIISRQLLGYLSIVILATAIFFSFSRSAWVGGIAGLVVFLLFYLKNIRLKYSLLGLAVILLLGLFIAYKNIPTVKDVLVHSSAVDNGLSSQEQHNSAWDSSVIELKSRGATQLFFGSGIGTAGPAAIKYSDGIVSESWYMQLLLELGIVGLALWIRFIAGLLIKFYRTNQGLFLGILAVSVAAMFLHTWADNPAVAITLLLLAGADFHLNSHPAAQ